MTRSRRSRTSQNKRSSDEESATPPDSQKVGYGRPPLHSRFQKGQSGNRPGRRKNSRNLKTIIQKALISPISIREGEKKRSVSKIEAVVLRQIEGALKGNDRALLAIFKMAAQVGMLDEAGTAFEPPPLSDVERELLQEILEKAGSPKPEKGKK